MKYTKIILGKTHSFQNYHSTRVELEVVIEGDDGLEETFQKVLSVVNNKLTEAFNTKPQLETKEESPKKESPKEESPKKKTPKKKTPKKETPKEETPKEESPKEESPKEESPKEETPKKETPKKETPKDAGLDKARKVLYKKFMEKTKDASPERKQEVFETITGGKKTAGELLDMDIDELKEAWVKLGKLKV